LQIILSFIKIVPSGDILGLAGYTHSFGTGELNETGLERDLIRDTI